ncbi:cytochrome P450 monooxygenase [Aspergillus ellipticus CBS 707.79]|uniref:Cytochrome P450 monooxygenase n=1 Tax=Aspergillus ellipticus CBS 707.79 TaxID=1448320 RepID=A0A319D194_9EURO|nr:cytochrome P450 monooxygenase [Aspergillus ellipticus CBS 707.79]
MAEIPWKTIHGGTAAYCYFRSTFTAFLAGTAITFLLRFLYGAILYPAYISPLKQVPTPAVRSWIKGNRKAFALEENFEEMRQWNEEAPNHGLLRYYMTANLERLVVTSPKALSEILVQKVYEFEKPLLIRRSLGRITGEHGVLLVEGPEHKRQRKNLMPAFQYRHIKNLYSVFWSKSIEMVNMIEKELQQRSDPADNVISIETWSSRATLDIIGVAGMNRDFNSLRDPSNDLAHHYHRIMHTPPTALEKFLFVIGLITGTAGWVMDLPLERNRILDESSAFIRNVARQMIREAREASSKDEKSHKTTDAIDIISVAVESAAFTEEELVDQMMTFLAAGHETTSSAFQWCIYALSKNPDVQTRLRDEIRAHLPPISVVDNPPEPLSAATIDSLPYLNAVCNEVFRFHPSAPSTIRVANRDTTLVGQPIAKGTVINIIPAITNHDKSLWGPDADTFNPDRWLAPGQANTGGASSNYAFLTFIHGPRSCIGQGFAKSELACLLAAFVGRFRFELEDPDKELLLRQGATVSPRDGVLAKLTRVEGW